MSVPDHIGKSIKITQGIKVSVPGPDRPIGIPRGKSQGFYRHGFPLDMYDWLITNVGETIGQHLWEEGQGTWLHTGSRWSRLSPEDRQGRLWLDFFFRDRRKAILFKLCWCAKV